MGAINFKTNNILITLCKNETYFINDSDIEEYKKEYEEINGAELTENEARNLYYNYISDLESEEFEEINKLLKTYNFEYYKIKLESGYYNGFQLLIDYEYLYFDSYIEKKENQKELTKLKNLMIELINNYNMLSCWPGWCSSWHDKKETLKELKEAITAERGRINKTPYFKEYENNYLKNYLRH